MALVRIESNQTVFQPFDRPFAPNVPDPHPFCTTYQTSRLHCVGIGSGWGVGAEGVGGDAGDEEGMAEEGGGGGEFVVVGLPGVHLEVGGWDLGGGEEVGPPVEDVGGWGGHW